MSRTRRVSVTKQPRSRAPEVEAVRGRFLEFLEPFQEQDRDPTVADFRQFAELHLWPYAFPFVKEGHPLVKILDALAAALNAGTIDQDAFGRGSIRLYPDETKGVEYQRICEVMLAALYDKAKALQGMT